MPDKLLDRVVSVSMIVLVLITLGVVGLRRLPVGLIPDVDIPQVSVQIAEPDMSARELEESVVAPLRSSLVQIAYLKDLHTISQDGKATLTLTLERGKDVDLFYIEVNEKIDRAMSTLPQIDRPKVLKASATDLPVFYLNLTLRDGGEDFLELSNFARDVIKGRIEQLPEVAMVDMSGCAQSEILVVPDAEKLESLGVSLQEFQSRVSSADIRLSNLVVRDGEYHYNVNFRSLATSAEDIAGLYFKVSDKVMRVSDVAQVRQQVAPRQGLVLSDGTDAVSLAVIKQSDARMSELHKSISGLIDSMQEDYPRIEFTITRDQSSLLEYSINSLLWNIVLAVLLVSVVIFFFMRDLRSSLLVSASIPLSLIISFFAFSLIGLTINIISLSGLLLGVGMMVDNSIVLVDNVTARWKRGGSLRDAVVQGTREVSGAMLSSVLTTCAVFVPLIFLDGLAGDLFYDQAMAIAIVLLTAYIVTVTVLPVYYYFLYRRFDSFPETRRKERSGGAALRLYDRITNFCLAHKWMVWALPVLSAALIAVCVATMPKETLPRLNYSDAVLKVDWNENIALEVSRERAVALWDAVKGECTQSTAMVGIQQFMLSHTDDLSVSETELYLQCADADALAGVKKRLSDLIRSLYPRAIFSFANAGNIFDMVFSDSEPFLQARLHPSSHTGLQYSDVSAFLSALREAGVSDNIAPAPFKEDIMYISDPELMALYGVSGADLVSALKNALNGNRLFEIIQGTRSVPVVMGTDTMELGRLLSTTFIDVRGGDGTFKLPLSSIMRESFASDFKYIQAAGDGVYYPVDFDRMSASKAMATVAGVKETAARRGDFDVSFSGTFLSSKAMVRNMTMVLLVAVLLLFLILASQFESLLQPLIILSEIVIDLAFCLLVLAAAGVSINIMSLIGLVVVCGIVINDSILKIDTINRLVRSGQEITSAIHEAGHRRLKAILMTSITTVLSVMPFLFGRSMGDELQFPMALVIVAGMTLGTVVSLFYVPAFYALAYSKKRGS